MRTSCRTNFARIFPHGGTNFGANSCANFRTNISCPFQPLWKGLNDDENFITKSTAEFTAKFTRTIWGKIHRSLLLSGSSKRLRPWFLVARCFFNPRLQAERQRVCSLVPANSSLKERNGLDPNPSCNTKTPQRAQRSKKINPDRKFQSRLKFSISLEIFNPGPSEFPTKNRGLPGGALENFNLDRKFQSRRRS